MRMEHELLHVFVIVEGIHSGGFCYSNYVCASEYLQTSGRNIHTATINQAATSVFCSVHVLLRNILARRPRNQYINCPRYLVFGLAGVAQMILVILLVEDCNIFEQVKPALAVNGMGRHQEFAFKIVHFH